MALSRLDGNEWLRSSLAVEHRVVHVDERTPPAPAPVPAPQPAPTATFGLAPTALALAAFLAAGCSGAIIASAAIVLSHL